MESWLWRYPLDFVFQYDSSLFSSRDVPSPRSVGPLAGGGSLGVSFVNLVCTPPAFVDAGVAGVAAGAFDDDAADGGGFFGAGGLGVLLLIRVLAPSGGASGPSMGSTCGLPVPLLLDLDFAAVGSAVGSRAAAAGGDFFLLRDLDFDFDFSGSAVGAGTGSDDFCLLRDLDFDFDFSGAAVSAGTGSDDFCLLRDLDFAFGAAGVDDDDAAGADDDDAAGSGGSCLLVGFIDAGLLVSNLAATGAAPLGTDADLLFIASALLSGFGRSGSIPAGGGCTTAGCVLPDDSPLRVVLPR